MKTFAIFAKFWEPGKVKTRLAASIGHSHAAAIYLMFLQLSLKICRNLEIHKVLGFSPQNKRTDFQKLAPEWSLIPQIESDLGTRMKSFFDCLFDAPLRESHVDEEHHVVENRVEEQRVEEHLAILIGSDSPLLPNSIVDLAYSHLESHDVVLGPSHDGGYYLIGARNRTPDIFNGVDWSTDKVLEQTKQQLEEKGLSYCLLPEHRDIDDVEDLKFLATQLKELESTQQEHRQLMSTIEMALHDAMKNNLAGDQVDP